MKQILALLTAMAVTGPALAQRLDGPPRLLPEQALVQLRSSVDAATPHQAHVWRDTPPLAANGLVHAYVEISRGDRRKWEYDMGTNARAIDRVMPDTVGPYPVNYGFVPQTVSYDGDPFDVLVLGAALPGGTLVRGAVVGLMHMEDEKGHDSKVVLSPVDAAGRPQERLTAAEQQRIAEFFNRYKAHEPGAFSRVPGWGSADEGRQYITMTHAFFTRCSRRLESVCRIE